MPELIYEYVHYAPLVVFVAAILDIFFLTGLLLYGFATLGTIGMLHMNGMLSVSEIIIAATCGTVVGNQLNYWTGRVFHQQPFVQKRLQTPRAQKAVGFLRTRGLFLFMFVGRSITIFRPLHGLILGTFNIKPQRVLMIDIPLSLAWVSFWLMIILYGETLWLKFLS